jgi:hypothetical protein
MGTKDLFSGTPCLGYFYQIHVSYTKDWNAYSKSYHRRYGPKQTIESAILKIIDQEGNSVKEVDIKGRQVKYALLNEMRALIDPKQLPLYINTTEETERFILQRLLRGK